MGTYDTAQICLNGHLITELGKNPEYLKNFCPKCGEKTIMNCQYCNNPIKGYHHIEDVFVFLNYDIPIHCENCGKAFPWTERQSRAAKDLIDLSDNLNSEEKEDLKTSIDDLIKSSPNTVVAQTKYKKYITKAGTEIAQGIKDVLIEVVSETVKKSIWG